MDYTKIVQEEDYLEHHGVKGMHWGIRRYQNADGSLTEEGKRRYDIKEAKIKAKAEKAIARAQVKSAKLSVKAEKLAAKNLKRETKAQEKLMKMDMKRLKKTAAYERGRKFGDAILPALGRSFGENWGAGMGRTLGDFQRWKDLKIQKIQAENKKAENQLARDKFDQTDYLRELALRELQARTGMKVAQNNKK